MRLYTSKEIQNIILNKWGIEDNIYYQVSSSNPNTYDLVYKGLKNGGLILLNKADLIAFRETKLNPNPLAQQAIEENTKLADSKVAEIQEGTAISVDNSDPTKPIVSFSGNLITNNEKAALDAANNPSGTNPFATIADITSGGTQDLASVLSNGNTNNEFPIITNDGNSGLYLFDGGDAELHASDGGFISSDVILNTSGASISFTDGPNNSSVTNDSSGLGLNTNNKITLNASDINISNPPSTSASTYDILTRNDSTGDLEKISSISIGTVTSVDLSMPSAFNVSGNPITTSGTIAVSGAGTTSEYIRGDGTLNTFPSIPSISGLVPYIGATTDVDLGAFSLNAKSLHIKGTGGTGHLGLKHQSANITANPNESSLGADSSGNPQWKNDGNAVDTLELQSNKSSSYTASSTTTYANTKALVDGLATKQNALGYTPENVANKGIANGYVPLNASTKIDLVYFPDVILGQVLYGGLVDISTAVATLTTNAKNKLGTLLSNITLTNNNAALTGYGANEGIYYIASVGGTFAGISFDVGDWLISIGTAWKKVDNTDAVVSVNGQTGVVTLTTSDISEGTNLYFTTARAIASVLTGYSSGAGTISASDTILQAIQKLNGNVALKSDIASPTFTGTVTTPAIIVSSETASRIAILDASKNIKSADTATYPSLTELSYVKGVTSAIQTQINAITSASTVQSRLRSAATSLTSTTAANVTATALTLAAGTWDISAMVGFLTGGANVTTTVINYGVSLTSATLPATDTTAVPTNGEVRSGQVTSQTITANSAISFGIPQYRVVLSGSTTFYLVTQVTYSTGALSTFGSITAIPVK